MGSKEHSLKTMGFIQPPLHLQMSALRFRLWGSGMLPTSHTAPGWTAVPQGRRRARAQEPESAALLPLCPSMGVTLSKQGLFSEIHQAAHLQTGERMRPACLLL